MASFKLYNTLEDISATVARIDEQLKSYRVSDENRTRSILTLEETLVKIVNSTAGTSTPIFVSLHRTFRHIRLRIMVSCPEITFDVDSSLLDASTLQEEYGPEAEVLIRDMILRANTERLRIRYSDGVNRVDILVAQNDKAMLYETLIAILVGVSAGLLARLGCSAEIASALNTYLFSPLYSLFLGAVAMIMVPMVFFSIATSVSGFGNLGALGRTGIKVFGLYLLTTMIGCCVAIGMNALFLPGRPGMMTLPEAGASAEPVLRLSLMDKLLSIVPDNFIGAFASADMMQVMFLAVLLGIACTQIGKYSQSISSGLEALNALFTQATAIISRFLPYAIFGALAQMTLTMEVSGIGALSSWLGVNFMCILVQLMLYLLLLWALGRLNPIHFIRKFMPAPITAFFTCSSSATMPVTMACCESMGISRKVFSFSIPLGANINMDGTSILFTITTLFTAGLYGLTLDVPTLISIVTSVMLISVAIPGVPGAGTACLLMLFAIAGVPAEAFGLVIGLIPLLELFETALNVTGDGAVTTIVAKSENQMDLAAYNS